MFKKINLLIRDYFGFSRTETRGLFFLLGLISLTLCGHVLYSRLASTKYQHLAQDRQELESMILQLESKSNSLPTNADHSLEVTATKRFFFDPNTTQVSSLLELGIPESLAQRIENYRMKGGKFYKPEDLLKIYSFPQDLYQELFPYIRIPQKKMISADVKKEEIFSTSTSFPNEPEENLEIQKLSLNLNEVDSVSLQQLKGIGTVLSSRIIKYRDKLGGFHSLDQLREIYHISDDALAALHDYSYVEESAEIRKINLNQADFKALLAHPYIEYELAKAIVNHRKIYGNFTSIGQLKEVYQINEELLVKLLPYLVI